MKGPLMMKCQHCNELIEGEHVPCQVCCYGVHPTCAHPDIELVLRRNGKEIVISKELDRRYNLWSDNHRSFIIGMIQQAIAEAHWR